MNYAIGSDFKQLTTPTTRSVIVGEGTPVTFTFGDIIWDGNLKYLNVELNIISNNEGFVFLDTQNLLP